MLCYVSTQQIARQFIDDEAVVTQHEEDTVQEEEPPGIDIAPSTRKKEKRKKKSWTWEYFVATGPTKDCPAKCKLCDAQGEAGDALVKCHDGSTRDMATHLRVVHNIGGVPQTKDTFAAQSTDVNPFAPRSISRRKCMWALTRWLLVDKRAFNMVESIAFRHFCQTLQPRFEVPGRTGVRQLATQIYDTTQHAVKEHLRGLWKYYPAYTADMWSAQDGSQYIALQLHLIDEEFNYQKFSTGAVVLPPPHDQVRIADAIDKALTEQGFNGQYIITGTTDSGANIRAAAQGNLHHDWIPCFNHVTHLVLGDVLAVESVSRVVAKARKIASMFRQSPAKWEQLRQLQMEQISRHASQSSENVNEEEESDVDDYGDLQALSTNFKLTQVLRPKIDQVTRWNSVYCMLQRLLELRIPIEMWYVSSTADKEADKLSIDEWSMVGDIVDILGIFRPLTVSLETAGDAAIVHLLPQVLRLTTKLIRKPAETAHLHSGRTISDISRTFGKSQLNVEQLISPLQKTMIDVIMAAYWGEKGIHGKREGRLNNFSIVYAWAICSGIYPSIIQKWGERIGRPLEKLISMGYCKDMQAELQEVYNVELVGNAPALPTIQESSESEDEEHEQVEGGEDAATPPTNAGKRKRKPNKKYQSSPSKPRKKRRAKKAKGGVVRSASANEDTGTMLKLLVLDEMGRLIKEAFQLHQKTGNERKEPTTAKEGAMNKGSHKHTFDYYSDSEEGTQVEETDAKPSEQNLEEEIVALKFETNQESLSVIEWWKKHSIKYPYLAVVARRLCAVRATSSEAERDFSVSGQISTKLRQRLSHETMHLCTYCSLNQAYVPVELPDTV